MTSLQPTRAWAIDTVEPFAAGATDVEIYVGSEGIGRRAAEANVQSSFQIGYGVTERLSAYVNGSASSSTLSREGERALSLGVYGTLVDTDRFDLDLFLDFGLSGKTLSTVGIAPGIEMNIDLGSFGLFANVWEVMSGREISPADDQGAASTSGSSDKIERVFDTELAIGSYWTVAEGHQLLARYDSIVHHVPENGQATYEVDGVGVGYNVMIHDRIELINEVRCDIPQGDEALAFECSTGILVTLP